MIATSMGKHLKYLKHIVNVDILDMAKLLLYFQLVSLLQAALS